MAPQVYAMRRSPMSKVAGALGTAAKAALAGGAAVGAGLLVKELASRRGESGETPKTEDVNISSDYSAPSAAEKGPEMSVSEPSTRDKAESFLNAFTGSVSTAPRNEPEVDPTGTPIKSALAAGFGSLEEARSSLQAKYGQRLSHQTEVPQADPNLANESFDAQRASVGEPVESLTTGMPAQAAPGVETAVAQAYEFFEGSPGKSPFQAGGAMNELGRQSRQVKQTVGDLPPQLASEVARFISNYRGNPVASEPEVSVEAPAQSEPAMRMAGSTFTTQIPNSSAIASVTLDPQNPEYMGITYGKTPDKTYGQAVTPTFGRALMSQMDRLSDPAQSEMEQSEMDSFGKMVSDMKEFGTMTKEGTSAPELLPGARPVFVTDKGIEVGNTLARAQEKEESKVTLGDIGQAALGVVKSVVTGKSAKRAARSAELDRTLAKGLGNLSPEQRAEQRDKILRKEGY